MSESPHPERQHGGNQPQGQPQYGQPQHGYDAAPPVYPGDAQPPRKSQGLGVAAMVCGIAGIVLFFIPFISLLSFILAPLALILGIIAVKKRQGRGMGIAGIITGAVGLVLVAITVIGVALFGDEIMDELEQIEQESGVVVID